jgi:hypothetical protein
MNKLNIIFENYFRSLIKEGGNAFPNTSRISLENIDPTIDEYKKQILYKIGLKDIDIIPLGSVGKKSSSGDLDLGIKFESLSKIFKIDDPKELTLTLDKAVFKYVETKSQVGSWQVYTSFPQYDRELNKLDINVQVDLMIGKFEWMKDWYASGYESGMSIDDHLISKYKGVYRNILIGAIMNQFKERISDSEFKKITASSQGISDVITTIKGNKGNILKNPKVVSRKIRSQNFREFFTEFFEDPNFDPESIQTVELLFQYIDKNRKLLNMKNDIIKTYERMLIDSKYPIPSEIYNS